MKKCYQDLIAGIPEYTEFLTVDELNKSSHKLAQKYPEITSIFEIGKTREGRSLLCLKIGDGERNALMFGCPHPNEPIGTMLLEYFSKCLAEDEALRNELGFTWYIVKAWDADGLVKNEGWLKGPYTIYNYGRHFFRPAGYQQVDWTFPIDYKQLHFHDALPETEAMANLIDQVKPEFIYALHNAGFGGTYWFESEPTPEIYEKLHAIPRKYDLPLSLGSAESPANIELAPAIYKCSGAQEEYDYIERFGSAEDVVALSKLRFGDNSASYAYKRHKAFTLLTELPYFYDRRIEDLSDSDMTKLEVRRLSVKESTEINRDLRRIMDISKTCIGETDPYIAAVESFINDSSGQASLNEAEHNPTYQKLATVSEKLSELVISKFYKMICYGMLVRANEEALKRMECETDEQSQCMLQAGYDAALEGLEKITAYLEENLQYNVIPIRKLIAVQLESGLAAVEYLKKRQEQNMYETVAGSR